MQQTTIAPGPDGTLQLRVGDVWRPISLDGHRVDAFNPGWRVECALAGDLLGIIALRHESGEAAHWFVDRTGARITDNPAALMHPFRRALATDLDRAARALLLGRPGAAWLQDTPASLRAMLADLHAPPPTRILSDPPAPYDAAHIATLFATDHAANTLRALTHGHMLFPSPIDGRPLPCAHGIAYSPFLFAYRIDDTDNDATAYVIATQHRCEPRALFLPREGALIARSDDDAAFIGEHFGTDIAAWLGAFALRHAPDWQAWYVATPRKPLVVTRETHIGHHLWNELSGLQDLLANPTVAAHPPEILVCNHTLSEMWGPLETIFPELAGRVSRGGDGGDLAKICLHQQIFPMRPSASRVPAALSARIRAAMQAGRALPHGRHDRVVLVNPRTENRTANDLVGLFAGLAREILAQSGPFTLVVDGHNDNPHAPTGTWLGVHWNRAAASPLQAERDVVTGLRTALADAPIEIIDNLGAPLMESIRWAMAASFHICIWGAGLAKYAWVAKRPGLAITSAWNLVNRHDLHIYDSEDFVEDPPLLLLPDPSHVTDTPAARQLVELPEPRFWNFNLAAADLSAAIARLLALPPPPN